MGKTRNSTAAIKVACAIAFLIFTFCYVYFFQTDVLAVTQHSWSGGRTHWNAEIGATLFTIFLFLIQIGISAISCFPQRVYALTFFPSLALLGMITSGILDDNGNMNLSVWGYIAGVITILFGFIVRLLNNYSNYEMPLKKTSLYSQASWINFSIMGIMMLFTIGVGNTDRQFHNRLKIERLVYEKQYDKALEVASKSKETDEAITMLRAFALSEKKQLGEHIFEYPINGNCSSLLPSITKKNNFIFTPDSILWHHIGAVPKNKDYDAIRFFMYIENKKIAKSPVKDYLLTSLLIERNLKLFVKEISKYYNVQSDTLPKHYREALVLYTHINSNRILTYSNSETDADYEDFQKAERTRYKSNREKLNTLHDSYGGTYWYYYYKNVSIH